MRVASVLVAFLSLALAAPAWSAGEDESRWNQLRQMLFQDRPIHDGASVLTLDAPYRAHDAAIVPISIEPAFDQSDERHIRTVTLLIDENPLPVAGRFHFTPASGRAALSTRVRVNAYTHIRAIAETGDGELYMVKKYVKASGGCSAPAGKDPDQALARLGKMKLRQSESLVLGEPNLAQLLVSHPNHTGMQMDQITHHYVPAHFVNNIEVRYGDETVLKVESDISLSEDPSIHFWYTPEKPAEMSVTVTDSKEQIFSRSWRMSGIDS